jgi:predicted Fe-S protein YdhL (DUF1289 family)
VTGAVDELEPSSPCVSICILDENDICTGCYRSAGEITDWMMASPEKKRAILTRVEKRREAEARQYDQPSSPSDRRK